MVQGESTCQDDERSLGREVLPGKPDVRVHPRACDDRHRKCDPRQDTEASGDGPENIDTVRRAADRRDEERQGDETTGPDSCREQVNPLDDLKGAHGSSVAVEELDDLVDEAISIVRIKDRWGTIIGLR